MTGAHPGTVPAGPSWDTVSPPMNSVLLAGVVLHPTLELQNLALNVCFLKPQIWQEPECASFVYHVFLLKTPSCFTQMSQSESTYRIVKETDFVNENGPGL